MQDISRLKIVVVLVVIIASSGCMEDVIRTIDTYPILYINASNINTTGALYTNGTLDNITEINNGYYNVSEINTQPFYVNVNFTNITNFSYLEVKAIYFSITGTPSTHVVDLEIYCNTDNEYEDLFFLENAAEWRYFTRHFPDTEHWIDDKGNVSIRFNHSANGNVNHRLYIDVVRLIIKESFEQNTITLYQNFTTTTTGGGGVSFNGSSVNLNGSNLFNGTISNYSTLDFMNSSLNNKVNKSGDTMTGSLKENRSNAFIGGLSFIDLTSLGLYGRTNVQFSLNRFYNETSLSVENGTYANKSGVGFALDTQTYPVAPTFKLFYYPPNSTSFTYWFSSDRINTTLNEGNLTITNLSGTGTDYVCVDSIGTLFRSNVAC